MIIKLYIIIIILIFIYYVRVSCNHITLVKMIQHLAKGTKSSKSYDHILKYRTMTFQRDFPYLVIFLILYL